MSLSMPSFKNTTFGSETLISLSYCILIVLNSREYQENELCNGV